MKTSNTFTTSRNLSTITIHTLRKPFGWRLLYPLAFIVMMLAASVSRAQVGGSVLVYSNQWLGGNGVNIYWNSNEPCGFWGSSYTICPETGQSVYTGCEWQCVELPQRLYTTLGWHCGAWSVSFAEQLWNNSSVGTSYPNGTGYVPVSGDLLIWNSKLSGSGRAGHVAVVDYVDAYNVYICEENWSSTGRAILSRSGTNGSFLTRSGVPSNAFDGAVHNPNNTFGNLAPTIPLWTWAVQPLNTNAAGEMDLWGVGTNGSVFHNYQTAANGAWNGWASMGLAGIQSGVTVARDADGRMESFARGSNNKIWHTWQTTVNGSWSSWADMASPAATGTPVVVTDNDGRLEVCVRSNNVVYDNFQTTPNGNWYGWISLGGTIASDLGPTREQDGRAGLLGNGTDGNVYYNHQSSPSGGWNGWISIGAPPGGSKARPIAAQNADGRLETYTLDSSGAVWRNYETSPNNCTNWNGWVSLGGTMASPVMAAPNVDGRIEIFCVGKDGNVYCNYQWPNAGSPFLGWVNLGAGAAGVQAGAILAVGNYANGAIAINVVGTDNAVYNNYQYPSPGGTGWYGWTSLGGGISYLFK